VDQYSGPQFSSLQGKYWATPVDPPIYEGRVRLTYYLPAVQLEVLHTEILTAEAEILAESMSYFSKEYLHSRCLVL
jgi:hypothetical protein